MTCWEGGAVFTPRIQQIHPTGGIGGARAHARTPCPHPCSPPPPPPAHPPPPLRPSAPSLHLQVCAGGLQRQSLQVGVTRLQVALQQEQRSTLKGGGGEGVRRGKER